MLNYYYERSGNMVKNYDAVVIGAGNGGLVAAARLAKEGKKTLLVERHNLPGGFATSFVRGRFEFEASLHELCGIGSITGKSPLLKFFRRLALRIKWSGFHLMRRSGLLLWMKRIGATIQCL